MFPLRDSIPPERRPAANWLLIAVNVAAFLLLERAATTPEEAQLLAERFGLVPERVLDLWRHPALLLDSPWPAARDALLPFLTSMFLHGGWLHLLGNLWFLHLFGDNVEGRLGRVRYVLFFLACGVVAALLHIAVIPRHALYEDWGGRVVVGRNSALQVPMIGASGAIAGVLGAYVVWFPRSRILTWIPILFFLVELPAAVFLGVWFLLQFVSAQGQPLLDGNAIGVAYWAHVGGFVAGVVFAWFHRRWRRVVIEPPRRGGW